MIDYSLDLPILKLLINNENYKRYRSCITDVYSIEAKRILKALDLYYTSNTGNFSNFVTWFFSHESLDKDDEFIYKRVFTEVKKVDEVDSTILIRQLKQRDLWHNLNKIKELDFDTLKMEKLLIEFNLETKSAEDNYFYTSDLKEAYKALEFTGIKPGLEQLENIVGVYGDRFTLLVAGRDSGKTAFCVNECVSALQQIEEDRLILYFNNEEAESTLLKRIYERVLEAPAEKINNYIDKATIKFNEKGGNRIKIVDIYGKGLDFIEKLCAKHKPAFVIVDQIDKLISGRKREKVVNYEDLYSGLRQVAHRYHVPIIGCTQAKNNGLIYDKDTGSYQHKEWLTLADAHNSNIDKQANCDIGLGLGRSNYRDDVRNITIDRAKGSCKTGRFSCILNQPINKFKDS